MFHPRGMGPRGMRPGMRPMFGPRGMGGQFDPRESEAFYRAQFDEARGPPGHLRLPFGPRMAAPPLMSGSSRDEAWSQRKQLQENGPPGVWDTPPGGPEEKLKSSSDRNRNRKSRWGNASPNSKEENWDAEEKEEEQKEDKSEDKSEPQIDDKKENDSWTENEDRKEENWEDSEEKVEDHQVEEVPAKEIFQEVHQSFPEESLPDKFEEEQPVECAKEDSEPVVTETAEPVDNVENDLGTEGQES